ncbi:hypothetical protein LAZ40_09675 [Cereibacter sphaeroides]|uniref:hypothetical protein n=1 Tax=Cereibacter sphaeroides TaxID=1063 RepID=UPI001F279325|nr:hypothetical protein [Cereibacter sphaeroides]MCE6959319.1 hypothetical protein [Cereibacter sphaeroides]MCE6972911.1 hypothetical protein [Cereibacter sphaeroides]
MTSSLTSRDECPWYRERFLPEAAFGVAGKDAPPVTVRMLDHLDEAAEDPSLAWFLAARDEAPEARTLALWPRLAALLEREGIAAAPAPEPAH